MELPSIKGNEKVLPSEKNEQRKAEEKKQKVEELWGSSKSGFQGKHQDQAQLFACHAVSPTHSS